MHFAFGTYGPSAVNEWRWCRHSDTWILTWILCSCISQTLCSNGLRRNWFNILIKPVQRVDKDNFHSFVGSFIHSFIPCSTKSSTCNSEILLRISITQWILFVMSVSKDYNLFPLNSYSHSMKSTFQRQIVSLLALFSLNDNNNTWNERDKIRNSKGDNVIVCLNNCRLSIAAFWYF